MNRKPRPLTGPCKFENCTRFAWAQGYCDPHYQKLKRLGVIKKVRIQNDHVARFHSKYVINQITGCWEWTGKPHPRGYPIMGIGAKPTQIRAHRFSFELHVGPVPKGLKVLHKCDNRLCVNPEHLFLGTDGDNMRDCAAKGRLAAQNGTNKPKMTDQMVSNIRVMYARGHHSYRLLAMIYGVDEETTRGIVKGRSHLAA